MAQTCSPSADVLTPNSQVGLTQVFTGLYSPTRLGVSNRSPFSSLCGQPSRSASLETRRTKQRAALLARLPFQAGLRGLRGAPYREAAVFGTRGRWVVGR